MNLTPEQITELQAAAEIADRLLRDVKNCPSLDGLTVTRAQKVRNTLRNITMST
mgnify:CR=1 FL=1